MSNTTVTIFGATGAQGAPIVSEALAKGMTVRAAARDKKKIMKMHPIAEPYQVTLDDEESIVQALQGVDAAFLHIPMAENPEDRAIWLKTFITAAHRVSLPLLVYTTSGPTGKRYHSSVVIDSATTVMQTILESAIPAIILQPAIYLENLLPEIFLPNLRSEGVLDYPPLPETTKVQWTSHVDQARIAVSALVRPDLAGNSYEIGTPHALTGTELAVLVSKWINRPVNFRPISPAAFGQRVGDAIASPSAGFALTDIYGSLEKLNDNQMVIDTNELQQTFGVSLQSVEEHLKDWAKI